MEAVEEVEQQRDRYQSDEDGKTYRYVHGAALP
jgi:hypothetical protein